MRRWRPFAGDPGSDPHSAWRGPVPKNQMGWIFPDSIGAARFFANAPPSSSPPSRDPDFVDAVPVRFDASASSIAPFFPGFFFFTMRSAIFFSRASRARPARISSLVTWPEEQTTSEGTRGRLLFFEGGGRGTQGSLTSYDGCTMMM